MDDAIPKSSGNKRAIENCEMHTPQSKASKNDPKAPKNDPKNGGPGMVSKRGLLHI
jgi:hypothetical protein